MECVRFDSAVVGESGLRSVECVRFDSAVAVSLAWDQWSVFGSISAVVGESGLGSVECVRSDSAVVGESGLGSARDSFSLML